MDAFFELATPVPSEEILSASGTDQVPTNAERTGAGTESGFCIII
nr:pheromone 6 [Grifola frondosa]